MTDQMQELREDIAFLRELTQDGGQGLAREGAAMLTIGAVFGVVTFVYWLLYAGYLPAARSLGYWLWIAGLVMMFAIALITKGRLPSPSGAASRAMEAAHAGAGISLTAAGVGLLIGGWRLGNPNLVLWIFPIVLFALYAAFWGVAFAVKRRGWFGAVAIGCLLTAAIEGGPAGHALPVAGPVARPRRLGGHPGLGDPAAGPGGGLTAMPGFDVEHIDEIIHGRMRLGIMAYLGDVEAADFNELKAALNATQGNLSIHLRKLEDAGYIVIDKSFLNRRPLTRARITPAGRKAFLAYLDAIAELVKDRR